MLKFGIKVGIAAGACIYLSEQGVWRENEHSVKAYEKLSTNLQPYIKTITSRIPIELPQLPSSERITFIFTHYWNKGVMSTFDFVQNVPQNISRLGCKGMQLLNNPELKTLFIAKPPEKGTETITSEIKQN